MPDDCTRCQEQLAEHVLTQPVDDSTMAAGLAHHLAGCPHCQAALAEFRVTAHALTHTHQPPSHPASRAPDGLDERIAAALRTARQRNTRRRRVLVVAASAAAALLILLSIATFRNPPPSAIPGVRVVLSAAGLNGEVILQSRPWGTQIHLVGTGFVAGQQYNMWLEQPDGTHIPAGTFTGVTNTRITVTLATALPAANAIAIGISTPNGATLARTQLT